MAFCFYENPVTDIYFCLKPGYEKLALEMVTYADENMLMNGESIRFIFFGGQDALMRTAQQLGYRQKSEYWDMQYDFANELHFHTQRRSPENHLAYMEPLCTIPEYRHKGLAAALSEMYRRTKALGATYMTGGENRFYQKNGYQNVVKWTFWQKEEEWGNIQ